MTKIKSGVSHLYKYGSLFVLAFLAGAGMLHLLSGVDPMVAYPVTVVTVAYAVREVL